jgi:signal transduction histidine kinase/ActR/RegA family two-component response regulator
VEVVVMINPKRQPESASDPDVRLQSIVLLLFGVAIVLLSLVWGTAHLLNGITALGIAYYVVAALFVAGVWLPWRAGARSLACHINIGLGLLWTATTTYATGGIRLTNISPFFALFIAPVFLLGHRGLVWTGLSFAVAIAFQILRSAGYAFTDLVPPEEREVDALVTWIGSALVVILFVAAYERARTSTQDRLRAALEAKKRLLANISHEIRNPLHAVMGINRVILQTPEIPEAQRALLETSQENAEGLLVLFDDLLDLARLEHGLLKLEIRDFDPVEIAESVERLVRHLGAAKGLQVRLVAAPDVPRRVCGDARRLRQILVNLGNNAVKFTERGFVEIGIYRAPDAPHACRFTVVDSGVGIDPSQRLAAFESFAQLENGLARRHDGAGLGLAICRELVERMGGAIAVAGEVGAGSEFTVTIPFGAPAEDGAVAAPDPVAGPADAARGGKKRVLVVDDVTVNREIACEMLSIDGYEVVAVCSGREGISAWREGKPDLVLMDLRMPDMDGFAAARHIRERERETGSRPVPIVAMTGDATEERRAECLAAGMDDCLFKPFDVEDLRRVVGRRISGLRSEGPS